MESSTLKSAFKSHVIVLFLGVLEMSTDVSEREGLEAVREEPQIAKANVHFWTLLWCWFFDARHFPYLLGSC
ncbi:hypothetical protein ECG_08861 [Echinococcus granulosus]|nr:hypothetical protein ECG_08861 [Echinococcus granulosus]